MSIKNYSLEEEEEERELNRQFKRLQVESLKLDVKIKEAELEKLHKM